MAKVDKAPGYDWALTYEDVDGKSETMDVFGCMTIEKAIEEARYSLNAICPFEGAIIKAERSN